MAFCPKETVLNPLAVTHAELKAAQAGPGRLFEDIQMLNCLRRLVAGFASDAAIQKDLLQECLLCLWRAECEKPGRTRSWYLQNCRFRIQHFLEAGRSVDSPKRGGGDRRVSIEGDAEQVLPEHHTNGELFENISFQDIVSTLGSHLKPKEKAVLKGLAEGLPLGDVAAQCDLSYPTALKYRRRIAGLTVKLGIAQAPPPESGQSQRKENT
jgi:DNA-directed RNA polymerase specialized sigma24 family protein